MAKRGRPFLPEGERKASSAMARLTAEERAALDKAAGRDGKQLSEWVRDALMAAADPDKKTESLHPNVWQYGTIYLQTPSPLSLSMWERLRTYVEVIKPSE